MPCACSRAAPRQRKLHSDLSKTVVLRWGITEVDLPRCVKKGTGVHPHQQQCSVPYMGTPAPWGLPRRRNMIAARYSACSPSSLQLDLIAGERLLTSDYSVYSAKDRNHSVNCLGLFGYFLASSYFCQPMCCAPSAGRLTCWRRGCWGRGKTNPCPDCQQKVALQTLPRP